MRAAGPVETCRAGLGGGAGGWAEGFDALDFGNGFWRGMDK
jgi:hypothetical protein